MAATHDYDLIVIGAGSGGVRLSRMSAGRGAKVAVIENRYLGGTCVNVGCVPKKLFVYSAHAMHEMEDAAGYGWKVPLEQVRFDWPTLVANKNSEIERLNGIYRRILEGPGVTVIEGSATFVDANTLKVGDQTITADKICIATGSWPMIPEIPGHDLILSSNEMFYLPQLPGKAVVWGGGYIAVEFAGILAGLGVDTTLIYRGDLFLRGFDEDVRRFTADEIAKKGVKLKFGVTLHSVAHSDSGYLLHLSDGTTMETGLVMAATGRRAMTDGLGIESVGVKVTATGHIEADSQFRTSVPSIYAIGDVIGTPQLTPVALAQGMALSRNLFGDGQGSVDYANIPTAVFCQPNIGTVGLTEDVARADGHRLKIFRSEFKPMKHTLSGRDERSMMKIIVDADTDRVLGVHMVGPDAGEIIQGMAVAVKMGATKADFDATVGIHPTSAEEFVTMREAVSEDQWQ